MSTKQILYSLGILIILGLIFAGLASLTRPVAPVAQETHVLAGTLTDQGDYLYTENKDYYTIQAAYPANTPLEPAADAKARATIEQALADEIANFKQDSGLNTLTPDDIKVQGLSADHHYALDMEYKMYTSSTTVSYAYQVYADTLGAHPNGYYMTFTFDQDGNQVMLADLFDPASSWLADISKAVTTQVTAQIKALTGGGDASMDIYPEGVAATPDNFKSFYLDGDTLGILIPPYQVAAYAAGSFDVRIPLASLAKDLKK